MHCAEKILYFYSFQSLLTQPDVDHHFVTPFLFDGTLNSSVRSVSFKWCQAHKCFLQLMIIASSQGIKPHVQHN